MNYDDEYTKEEIRLMSDMKGQSRMQQDEMIGEYEDGHVI